MQNPLQMFYGYVLVHEALLNHYLLFVLRFRTTMVQNRAFATIGPFLRNVLPSYLRVEFLSRSLPTIFSLLKNVFILLGFSHWECC